MARVANRVELDESHLVARARQAQLHPAVDGPRPMVLDRRMTSS